MKLIIGLGNPDKKYQNTRHNLGSNILKQFVETFCKTSLHDQSKFSAMIAEYTECKGDSCGRPITTRPIFAIPTEYMNNSGIAVQKIANFYKISPQNIYVIHDDLDLPVGEYRVQFDRGPAGHNGIKSIIENIGTQQFNRIRVGIGKPQNNVPVEDYVLQSFSSEEKKILEALNLEIFKEIQNIL